MTTCSSTVTLRILSPGLGSEIVMPGINQSLLVLIDNAFDACEFSWIESKIASQSDGVQPELGGARVTIDVHMRRLVRFMTVEV